MQSEACTSKVGWTGALLLAVLVGFHFWGATVGWTSKNLPGVEFRQAQTALATYFIQAENNYALAYPTPVLGPPWSIPMEFPLYQWTVAKLSTWTGLDLTSAGRAVSLSCFYLALPAVFLLLGHLGVPASRRWLPLGMILTCPLYIYYSRAFLIETMALMFSLWFLLAFVEAVKRRSWAWLILANVTGVAAGLVKVTTFMLYLAPAGGWALWMIIRAWPTKERGGWLPVGQMIGLIVLATFPAFGVTLWWIHYADSIKALNPNADFLLSASLNGFNFGFDGVRWSADIWLRQWEGVKVNLAGLPVLAACLVTWVMFGRRWRAQFFICTTTYLSVMVLFPQLYAWHDYYSVANGVWLMVALSFGLLALAESNLARGWIRLVTIVVLGGQVWLYCTGLYQSQRHHSPGGSGLTAALNSLMRPDDIVVIVGEDWSSITPYYAKRRALMIRSGMENNPAHVEMAFNSLKQESVGAVVLPKENPGFDGILALAEQKLGIDPRPVLQWRDFYLYLNAAQRARLQNTIWESSFHEVSFAPGFEPKIDHLANRWYEYAGLKRVHQQKFSLMRPAPVRFFSTFGPGLGSRLGRTWYNAHPTTQLRFALPAGSHRLKAEFMMDAATYASDLSPDEQTDGVNVILRAIAKDGAARDLFSRLIAPVTNVQDRGPLVLVVDFVLEADGEVELVIDSGPAGKDTRDWALLGAVQFN